MSRQLKWLALLLLLFSSFPMLTLQGQPGQGSRATIMVVPWTRSDENILEKLDNDFNYRVVLNEIKRAFDQRGFSTIDFAQRLKNADINRAAGMDNWRDIFKDIIDNSPADITVQAEVFLQEAKYGQKVQLTLEAIETSSSESLANSGLLESPSIRTKNYATLVEKALEKEQALEEFLNLMNSKFASIRKDGRVTVLRIEVGANSEYNLHTMTEDGDFLADLIQDWVDKKYYFWAEEGLVSGIAYNIDGNSSSLLSFEQFRIPFADENGRRYDINRFAREIRKAIVKMGKKCEKGDFFKLGQQIRRNVLTLSIKG